MNKKGIIWIVFSILVSSAIFFVDYTKKSVPQELYRVYLKGETIGYIQNKGLLEEYIDREQYELKEKYNVEKVFLPNDLDIVKEITYGEKVSSEREIYEKIKDIAPFTVSGYTITIKGVEELDENNGNTINTPDKKIYVIDKKTFDEAVKKIVLIFVQESDYNNFVNNTQAEIKDVGKLIEDVYIKNQILITEGKISAEELIFTSIEELDRYLLYGTLEDQKKYIVKSGDSIKKIANNNKMSVQEFLIVNPDFSSEKNLLYEGQEVNIGLTNPMFKVVEEDHVVEYQTKTYDTKIEYDENMLVGYDSVKQNGENGTLRVTKKVQKTNGEVNSAVITKTEVIKDSIPRIIVKGSKVVPHVGNVGVWAWPTAKPYVLYSKFEWRNLNGVRSHHDGLDISGPGCGSPIYAANNGVVEAADFTKVNGLFIIINHNNGYYTIYGHMSELSVKKGQVVEMGQYIGKMGATGKAYGCHLHFGISEGYPFRGTFLDPLDFY